MKLIHIIILGLLFISQSAFSQSYQVSYKVIDDNPLSSHIQGLIDVKNQSGQDVPLSELNIHYYVTPEDDQLLNGVADYAAVLGSNYRDIRNEVIFSYLNNAFVISFTDTTGVLLNDEVIRVQYRINKANWGLHDQLNDLSFDPTAIEWKTTKTISVNTPINNGVLIGATVVNVEDQTPVPFAQVIVNGVSTQTNANGELSTEANIENGLTLQVRKDSYVDYYEEIDSEDATAYIQTQAPLASAQPLSYNRFTRPIIGIKRVDFSKDIVLPAGGTVAIPNDDEVSVLFPGPGSGSGDLPRLSINVQLTDFSNGILGQESLFNGHSTSVANQVLNILYVVDVKITPEHNPYERLSLDGYGPFTIQYRKQDCTPGMPSTLPVWFFDDENGPGSWTPISTRAQLTSGPDLQGRIRCFYEVEVPHFTRWALAEVEPSVDLSFYAPQFLEPSHPVRLELDGFSRWQFTADMRASDLNGYDIQNVPLNTRLFLRITDLVTGDVIGHRIDTSSARQGVSMPVVLDNFSTPTWGNWFSRDYPSGNGDYETFALYEHFPNEYCEVPFNIRARLIGGTQVFYPSATATPDVIKRFNRNWGFSCVNADQPLGSCNNYEISLLCP